MTIYHPFMNVADYSGGWNEEYEAVAVSAAYADYVERFTALMTGDELTDWSGMYTAYDGENITLQLTEEQAQNCVDARLIILGSTGDQNGQFKREACMSVSTQQAEIGGDGLISVKNNYRALYVYSDGKPVFGPVGFGTNAGNDVYFITTLYRRGSAEGRVWDSVKYTFTETEPGVEIAVVPYMYDSEVRMFTNRLAFQPETYDTFSVLSTMKVMPDADGTLVGFDEWAVSTWWYEESFDIPMDWNLRFTDEKLSGMQLYATIEITDIQGNRYCSQPVLLKDEEETGITVSPATAGREGLDITCDIDYVNEELDKQLAIVFTAENTGKSATKTELSGIIINGEISLAPSQYDKEYFSGMKPGAVNTYKYRVKNWQLYGIDKITEIRLVFDDDVENAYTYTIHGVDVSGFWCDYSAFDNNLGNAADGGADIRFCGMNGVAAAAMYGNTAEIYLIYENNSDKAYSAVPKYIAFDGVLDDEFYGGYVWLAPGTKCYLKCSSWDFASNGRGGLIRNWNSLCVNAQSVAFICDDGRVIDIPLMETPEFLRETSGEYEESTILVSGDMTVSVDGLFVLNGAPTLMLTAESSLDKDEYVSVMYTVTGSNGKTVKKETAYLLSAGLTQMCDVSLFGYSGANGGIDSIKTITMEFSLLDGHKCSGTLTVNVDAPVTTTSTYAVLPADISAEVGVMNTPHPPVLDVKCSVMRPEHGAAEELVVSYTIDAEGGDLYSTVYIDSVIINGNNCIQICGVCGRFYGGDSRTFTLSFDEGDFIGITEVSDISLEFSIGTEGKSGYKRLSADCEFEAFTLTGTQADDFEAISAVSYKGVYIELGSISIYDDDAVALNFRYTNDTDEWVQILLEEYYAEDIRFYNFGDSLSGAYLTCEPHATGYFSRALDRTYTRGYRIPAWFDKLDGLECLTIKLYGGDELKFCFEPAYELPKADSSDLVQPSRLNDEGVVVTLDGIVLRSGGSVSAALEIRNETAESVKYDVYVTVRDDKGNSGRDYSWVVIPSGITVNKDVHVYDTSLGELENLSGITIEFYRYTSSWQVSDTPEMAYSVSFNETCEYYPDKKYFLGADEYTVEVQ